MDNKTLNSKSKPAETLSSPLKSEKEISARLWMWSAVLLTLLAYWPLANNQFVDWDDTNYIQHNVHIRDLSFASIRWMFTHFYGGFWIPLTWFSLALDYAIGRLEPWVYHLDNLVLHLLNTALVFLLSVKLLTLVKKNNSTSWILSVSFGAALLFGLHPIHVESVAWAAERKDLLCGLFSLLSLIIYLNDTSRPKKSSKYFWCLGFFALALLSKPMAVSLPFVFILLDYWPFDRFNSKTLLEKIPFFLLSILSAVLAIRSQSGVGTTWGLSQAPLSFRFTNSCHSLTSYFLKMLVPTQLTTFYPIHLEDTFSPEYLFSVLAVVLISMICWMNRQKRPYLIAAWLYYLVTLAPALGIIQVGNQAAGDRFTYLPSLAPFLLAAAALVTLLSRWRAALVILTIGWTALLGCKTFQQVSVWKDSASLWENVLRVQPHNNLIVYNNLGRAYEDAGRWDDALAQYENADRGSAPFFYARWGIARVLADKGLWDKALAEYQTAQFMNPQFPPLYSGLGMVYENQKSLPKALAQVQRAVQLDPRFADAYNELGTIYRDQAQYEKSIEALKTAASLDPDNPVYFRNLIATYQKAGQHQQALLLYRQLAENPRSLLSLSF